jgi:hypothetical protein
VTISIVPPSPLVVDGVTLYELAPELADPIYWVAYLGDALTLRYQRQWVYDAYYRGEHALPSGPTSAHHTYRRLLRVCRSNWAELVVDAVNERLRVVGFRWTGDEATDLDVWSDIWQRNNLDASSDSLHVEALVWGYAYAIVWPDMNGNASITVESPTEVICYAPAAARNQVTMALKRWQDDWGVWHATYYTPTAIYKYDQAQSSGAASSAPPRGGWIPRETALEPWPLPNPFGQVPVIEFPNNPRLNTGGRSELEGGVVEMIDRINETVFNRLLAAQFSAFRQKWITGMEIPRDPNTGNPMEPFRSAVDRLWMSENPDAKFGEFSEASLTNYVTAAEADIQHLSSITRTPAYYLFPHGQMPSGEALKAAESGLVAKVKRRQRFLGEAWEQAMRFALLIEGDDAHATDFSCETLWAPAETKSDAGTGDLLVKLGQIGVPDQMLWELSGYFSPQQISRMNALAAAAPLAPVPKPDVPKGAAVP